MAQSKPCRNPAPTFDAPSVGDLSETAKKLNATSVDFLKADVETALTFSGMALQTHNEGKKQRNRKNARRAYDTILRLSRRLEFRPAEHAYMIERLDRLKNDLTLLGETF